MRRCGAVALRWLTTRAVAAAAVVVAARMCSSNSNSSSSTSGDGDSGGGGRTSTSRRVRRKTQIAVVGSGPSGCYVAAQLTRKHADVHVDVYERLPVAFGLCRYGVAPDHADVKAVEEQYLQLFRSGRVTWLGNLCIGKDIDVHALRRHYAAVVFATGASQPRTLALPGADTLAGVLTAKSFVDYYNTVPFPHGAPRFCPVDLSRCRRALVLGNGNVALDVARVLSADYTHFATTDMNAAALRELAKHNRVAHIDVVARRGVAQSAFTTAELRELSRLAPGRVHVTVDAFDLPAAIAAGNEQADGDNNDNNSDTAASCARRAAARSPRAHRRLMEVTHTFCVSDARMRDDGRRYAANEHGELLHSDDVHEQDRNDNNSNKNDNNNTEAKSDKHMRSTTALASSPASSSSSRSARGPCEVRLRYHLRPLRVLPSATRRNCVGAVLFERTDAATARDGSDDASAAARRRYCVLPCDIVFTSLGFCVDEAAATAAGLPIDAATGAIANDGGRVRGLPRVYCVGWARHGARGTIASALTDAQEVSEAVLCDVHTHHVSRDADTATNADHANDGHNGDSSVSEACNNNNNNMHTNKDKTDDAEQLGKFGLIDQMVQSELEPVTVGGLQRILHVERERGIDLGKRAEKIDRVRDMLDIALGGSVGKQVSDRVRGIMPVRPAAMQLVSELVDDHTDMRPLMQELLRSLPPSVTAQLQRKDESKQDSSSSSDSSSKSKASDDGGGGGGGKHDTPPQPQ